MVTESGVQSGLETNLLILIATLLQGSLNYENKNQSLCKTELLGLRPEWDPNPLSWGLCSSQHFLRHG